MKLTLAFLLLGILIFVPYRSVGAAELHSHYENPFYDGFAGHVAIDIHDGGTGIPLDNSPADNTVCFAYGLGSNALSTPINNWNVWGNWIASINRYQFTNLVVPNPIAQQVGVNSTSAGYGSTACQVYQNKMGFQVHKPSSTNPSPRGDIYGMQMASRFDILNPATTPLIRPWADSFGANTKLRLQVYEDAPNRYATARTVQYGQIVVNLVDMSSIKDPKPRNIWWSIHTWDTRGHQPESVQPDTVGTTNLVVVTDFYGNQNYSTAHYNSQNSNGNSGCGCLWYGAYVTKANLLNAINRARSDYGINFSTNPNDYVINLAAVGPEMYSPSGTDGWISEKVWEFKVLTEK